MRWVFRSLITEEKRSKSIGGGEIDERDRDRVRGDLESERKTERDWERWERKRNRGTESGRETHREKETERDMEKETEKCEKWSAFRNSESQFLSLFVCGDFLYMYDRQRQKSAQMNCLQSMPDGSLCRSSKPRDLLIKIKAEKSMLIFFAE